jgi:FkbM family methyltransferase
MRDSRRLWIRDEFDQQIAHFVLNEDEYRLSSLHASGRPVRRVLDVGGHVGSFTRAVKTYWPGCEVIAVEPNPESARYFRLNTSGLPGVTLHDVAIVAEDGPATVSIVWPGDRNAAACQTRYLSAGGHEVPSREEVVAATSIMNVLTAHGCPDIDIVKLDCEGPEAMILEELQRHGYLYRVGWICGEWHGRPNIPLIKDALAATHQLTLYEHEHPWGAFFGEPRT